MKSLRAILAGFILATLPLLAFAQDVEKETKVIQDIANEACNCLNEVSWENLTEGEILRRGEVCLEKGVIKFLPQIMLAYNTDEFTEEMGRSVGEKMAIKLLENCDAFSTFSRVMAKQRNKEDENGESSMVNLTGKITGVQNEKGLQYLVLEEADGTTHRLFWFVAFDGHEDFPTEAKAFKGRSVEVSFRQVLVYIPKEKSYQPRKVLLGMQEL